MKKIFLVILLTGGSALTLLAQMSNQDVRMRLEYIYNGQTDRVRQELPSLEKQYPNDAGVLYLEAILTTDGVQAEKKFQAIVDHFPESDWADDALYKVYQYYYSIGLYITADQKLTQLKKQYPNSIYVADADSGTMAHSQAQRITGSHPSLPARMAADTNKTRESVSNAPPADERVMGKYAVQTGAFSTMNFAQRQSDFLSTIGRRGTINPKQVGDKTLYVVSVVGFSNEMDARNFIIELKNKYNLNSIIIHENE